MIGDGGDDELGTVLAARAIHPLFQPLVHLSTGAVVGYEALARGPEGSALHTPDALFAAARRSARLAELDLLCRTRALEVALDRGLPAPLGLFVNVEPDAVSVETPPHLLDALAARGVPVTVEVTERSLTTDPARLVTVAEQLRDGGVGIALDDVGAVPASVALMPFLRPDVVKLDMRLVQERPDREIAHVMTAVTAHAERSGAWVLAEGIETEAHELMALSMGAQLGQGWRYGRPAELPLDGGVDRAGDRAADRAADRGGRETGPSLTRPVPPPVAPRGTTPYRVAQRQLPPRFGSRSLMIAVSRLLEAQAAEQHGFAVLLATFQDNARFTSGPLANYGSLARSLALVVAFGAGFSAEPATGVQGVDLADDDPMLDEWDVVVVGPHFAAALLARERPTGTDRSFDYVLTYDRDVVLESARVLLARAARPVVGAGVG